VTSLFAKNIQIIKKYSLLKILLQRTAVCAKKYEKRKELFLKHEYIGFSDFAR